MQTRREWLGWLATCGLALGLTLVFWLPIWCGAGFVGGDIYSYFFPQKVIYSEALHAGELPLWNAHAGFGYPLLAESQTGIFYPPNLVLYRLLDPHSAFHVSFLLHYFLAFVFASAAAQRLGLNTLPSWLTALVYVYGWFPPRTCVEWAIIGGTWLPAALWCAESFLLTRLWRYAIGVSGVLAVQLLAGHFQIAWFTLLLLAAYVPVRAFWFCDDSHQPSAISHQPNTENREPRVDGRWPFSQPGRITVVTFAAIVCGVSLAAVQLFPTYELKVRSQRATVGKEHELEFGAIPPWYWTQINQPSHWYSPLTDREDEFRKHPPLGHARTNSAEAHLFFGLTPLLLIASGLGQVLVRRNRRMLFWFAILVLSGLYTSGWLLPVTRFLPGFSYFQGAGRYGLLTTWSAAVLAGTVLDRFLRLVQFSRAVALAFLAGVVWSVIAVCWLCDDTVALVSELGIRNPLTFWPSSLASVWASCGQCVALLVVVLGVSWGLWWLADRPCAMDARQGLIGLALLMTALEFWMISRLVTFAPMVESPPLKSLEHSPVRQKLLEAAKIRPTLRLFAPGANLPTTLGVSSTPIYLTFGPAEYVDESLRQADDWIGHGGVTHVLTFEPQPRSSSMQLVWQGDDPFLNRAWGRVGQPLYLYEVAEPLGRLQFRSQGSQASESASWMLTAFEPRANSVECFVLPTKAGVLVLLDLDYPGWTVTVDGHAAESLRIDNLFRGVRLEPGEHHVVWTYRPRSFVWGAALSLGTFLFLAAVAHIRFWHPNRLRWLDDRVAT